MIDPIPPDVEFTRDALAALLQLEFLVRTDVIAGETFLAALPTALQQAQSTGITFSDCFLSTAYINGLHTIIRSAAHQPSSASDIEGGLPSASTPPRAPSAGHPS